VSNKPERKKIPEVSLKEKLVETAAVESSENAMRETDSALATNPRYCGVKVT
jgi:hypothetical protein